MSKQKQKGTAGENEVVRQARIEMLEAFRTSPGTNYDVVARVIGSNGSNIINALATRPDYGQWLVTVPLHTLLALVADDRNTELHIEVKRYARFSLHSIYEKKFGGSNG